MSGRSTWPGYTVANFVIMGAPLSLPGCFGGQQTAQLRIARRRFVERRGEALVRLLTQPEEPPVEQHRVRLTAGRRQHEIRAIRAERLRRLIDQRPLPLAGAQADRHVAGLACLRPRAGHGALRWRSTI